MAAFLPALLCGGGMVFCMWLMSRGHRSNTAEVSASESTNVGARDGEIAELREELARLRSELESRDHHPA